MLLTEKPSMLGIGAFNHGFRTPSSLFYINSLFYLPYIKFYSFHMAAILFMGFANLILLQKLINFIKPNNHAITRKISRDFCNARSIREI
jgi:hypothetical protein